MQPTGSVPISLSRRIAIIFVMLLFLYIFSEVAAFIGLLYLQSKGKQAYAPTLISEVSDAHRDILSRVINREANYIGYSRELGWTTLPNGENELYRANSQGVRGVREYTESPPQGILRIAAFGDSYVHGDDVPNPEAWSILLEEKASNLELMNFGVGGHGPDQGYLRYLKEGRDYSPHIVFIGFQSENINRVVNVYRPFYSPNTGNPLAKPYFKIVDRNLVKNENHLSSLSEYRRLLDDPASVLMPMGKDDFHYNFRYQPGPLDWSPTVKLMKAFYFEFKSRFMNPLYQDGKYQTSSEAYQLVVAIIENFRCDVLKNGSLPVVVLFPNRADLAALSGSDSLQYQPLKEQLLAAGYSVIDLSEAFSPILGEKDLSELIKAHYTGQGNDAVAEYLISEIDAAGYSSQSTRNKLMQAQARLCRE